MLSSAGTSLVKSLLQSEVSEILPGTEITYLEYDLKNFSVIFRNGDNKLSIYGEYYPLNAIVEGDFKRLSGITEDLRGDIKFNGKVIKKNGSYLFNGLATFAGGILNYECTYDGGLYIKADGSDFDIKRLLYMLKMDFPYVYGITDMSIIKNKDWIVTLKSKGEYKKDLQFLFKSFSKLYVKNRQNIKFLSNIKTDMADAYLKGDYKNSVFKFNYDLKDLNVSKLKKYTLYPLKGKIDLKGTFDGRDYILKFENAYIEGFRQKGKTEINFKMPGSMFFNYLNIQNFLGGIITGNLKIKQEKGSFDIIDTKVKFKKNFYTKKIYALTGVDLTRENVGNLFFKGFFDRNGVNFEMLSKSRDITLNIKNGYFGYDGNFKLLIFIRKKDTVFKLLLKNNNVKLLNKKIYNQYSDEILVF